MVVGFLLVFRSLGIVFVGCRLRPSPKRVEHVESVHTRTQICRIKRPTARKGVSAAGEDFLVRVVRLFISHLRLPPFYTSPAMLKVQKP